MRSIWTMAPSARALSTRERIMDAAAMLCYEHGYHALGIDRRLGVVGGS